MWMATLSGKMAEVAAVDPCMKSFTDILHGRAGEEVLLLQAQLLALVVVILGVQHLGNGLGQFLFLAWRLT